MAPLYTLDKLASITNHNPVVMDKFNRSFLEQTIGTDLPRLVEAVRMNDFHGVFQSAHRMKTSVHVYNITSISDVLSTLENRARTETQVDTIPALAKQVAETLMEVGRDLKEQYTNRTAS